MPSGSDSVFQCARPARSLTEYDGPLPARGRTAPSRNSTSATGRSIRWAAGRIDLDRPRVHRAGLRQVLGLGAERGVERGGDVAHVGDGGIHRQRHADAEPAPGRARLGLLAPQLVVARDADGLVQRRGIIAAVVVATRRRAIRELLRPEEIAPAELDGVEAELLREAVHHAFGLEVEVAARVAAVGSGEALVGHHHRSIDFEMLKTVRTNEITGRTKTATRLGTADVAADVVQPLEAHAEHGAVRLRRHLAVRDAVGAARRGEEMLAAVLDPLHGHAGVLRRQPDQRHVGGDARLYPERAADVW